MQVRLDRFGRVVVPKPIREALGLEPGAALELEEEGGRVLLRPLREEAPLRESGGVLVYCGRVCGSVEGAVERTRRQRAERLAR